MIVPAGPVAVGADSPTPDSEYAFVAARMLERDPAAALLGYADTGGIASVGLALFHGGRALAVANSNRFDPRAGNGNLTIIDALAVKPALLRTVPAGSFPRSIDVAPDDAALYLTNDTSRTLQVVSTTGG